jgi:predicted Zn-dependent peptidase
VPHIPIERHRLQNGLRVVLSRDQKAPIVAVNLWYDVGSKHEQPGKTGFAHLFEHMMFQGSENVAKGEHFGLVQAAGGTLNASTWLDRPRPRATLPPP